MKRGLYILFGLIVLLAISYFYIYPKLTQPQSTEFKDVVISLERTGCYGTCPSYQLTVYGDGKVVYNGINHVKKKGLRRSRISQNQVMELVTEIKDIDYFSLRDSYDAPIEDKSSVITSATIDGQTKKVVDLYSAPKELIELENNIDKITDSSKWVGK